MKKTVLMAVSALVSLLSGPLGAIEVSDCDWRARADAIAEPREENSRTFSNGKTRLALLDTVEPGAAPLFLLVMSPPYSEMGIRQCKVIGFETGIGFGGVDFGHLQASYEPAVGLTFSVPVVLYPNDAGLSNPSVQNSRFNK